MEELKNLVNKFGITKISVPSTDTFYVNLMKQLNLVKYNNIKQSVLFVDTTIDSLNSIKKHRGRKIILLTNRILNVKSFSRYVLKLRSIRSATIYVSDSNLKVKFDRLLLRCRLLKLESNQTINIKKDIINNKIIIKELPVNDTNKNLTFDAYLRRENIRSVCISLSLEHFNRIKNIYNLKDFSKNDDSSLFFGIYDNTELIRLKNFRGKKYVVFGGSDCDDRISNAKIILGKLKNMKNINYIAISQDIKNRLDRLGMRSTLVDFSLLDTNIFKPVDNIGHKIYIYDGQGNRSKHKDLIYNRNIIDDIMKKLPEYEYILSSELNVSYEEMAKVYSECFIGLRLTDRDGNANTVQEFKAMNIPIVHNGSDYGLKWKNVNDVVNHIKNKNNLTTNLLLKLNSKKYDFYKINSIDEEILQNCKKNIELFTKLVSKYKNILFISGDYPGYGGAATNCDELDKYFKSKGFNTFAYYYKYEEYKNCNFKPRSDQKLDYIKNISKIKFKPDLIILKSPTGYDIKKIFNCPIYYLVGGIYTNKLEKYYYNISNKTEHNKYINTDVLKQIKKYDMTFVNSSHTMDILKNVYNLNTNLFYSSLVPFLNRIIVNDSNFDNRKYEYGLIVSDFTRKIKNVEDSIKFLTNKKNVILIGKNSDLYKKYGFECVDLVDKNKMDKYYKNIKYIIQDSFYESCSNVKIESLFNSCKIKDDTKNIVIISEDYPGFGGFGSRAYTTFNKFKSLGFDISLCYIDRTLDSCINTNKLDKNIHSFHLDEYYKSLKIINGNRESIDELYVKRTNKLRNYYESIVDDKSYLYILSPKTLMLMNKFFPNNEKIYSIGSLSINKNKFDKNISLFDQTYNEVPTEMNYALQKKNVIVAPLSKLVKKYLNLDVNFQFENSICFSHLNNSDIKINNSKEYDLIFITSDITRYDKNFELCSEIYNLYPKLKKIIIGNGSSKIKMPNLETYESLPNKKVHELLKRSKILLLTSNKDAAPGVFYESILNQCIPIISHNCGFAFISDKKYKYSINLDYKNWIDTINLILDNYTIDIFDKKYFGEILNYFNSNFSEIIDYFIYKNVSLENIIYNDKSYCLVIINKSKNTILNHYLEQIRMKNINVYIVDNYDDYKKINDSSRYKIFFIDNILINNWTNVNNCYLMLNNMIDNIKFNSILNIFNSYNSNDKIIVINSAIIKNYENLLKYYFNYNDYHYFINCLNYYLHKNIYYGIL
jgi:hypothetical protein